jgi:hypothetical protein
MAVAASQGMLDQLIDASAIRAAAAAKAAAAEAFNPDIKRRKTLDAEMAERIECRKAYSNYLYVKEQEAGARRLQTDYLTFGAKKWLDLVSMCRVGYWDFDRDRAASQISADQSYFNSHPTIQDGAVREKHLVEQLDAYEGELADSNLRWWKPTDDEYLGGPKHLHAIAQTCAKLRLLRTPLEFLDHGTRWIVAELRGEHFVAPQVMPPDAPLRRSLTLSDVVPELLGLNAEARSIAEHSIVRECLAEHEYSGFNTPDGDPRAAILRELRRHPEIFSDAIRIGLQRTLPEIAREPSPFPGGLVDGDEYAARDVSTNNVVIFPSGNKVPLPDAKFQSGPLQTGRKQVSVLGGPAASDRVIEARPQPAPRKRVVIRDLLSPGDLRVYEIQEASGLSFKEKKALQVEVERKKGVGLSSANKDSKWSEAIEKAIKRCADLQRVLIAADLLFPDGFSIPFDAAAESSVRDKLVSYKPVSSKPLPNGAIDLFLLRLRIFLNREID